MIDLSKKLILRKVKTAKSVQSVTKGILIMGLNFKNQFVMTVMIYR